MKKRVSPPGDSHLFINARSLFLAFILWGIIRMNAESTTTPSSSHTHHATPAHEHTAAPAHSAPKPQNLPLPLIAAVVLVVLIGGAWYFSNSSAPATAPITTAPTVTTPTTDSTPAPETLSFTQRVERSESLKRTLTKAKYTIELYRVDRSSYDLFESAAIYTGSTLDEIKSFYLNCCDLTSEADIFSDLPPIPSDFPSVAYDIATGSLLQLGQITKSYYLQPELYFHVGETAGANRQIAFRAWSQPQLEYWGDNGHLSYPNQQWGTITKSKDNIARAVVFYASGWNIQNYQGLMLVPNADAKQYFDVVIESDSTGQPYFLLGPTFPKFDAHWAEKVTVTLRAKPGTPAGEYHVGINPTNPPREINEKWANDHKGLYFGGRGSIIDGGNQIEFIVTVVE